jgi:acetyl-CoA synthetase
LRRHGDGLARLPGGAYAARGRVDDAMNLGGIKVAAVELEGAVLRGGGAGFTSAADLAAVAVPSPGGGPDALVLVLVPGASSPAALLDTAALASAGTAALRGALSPLFRVDRVVLRPQGLPRTATGKVMRRVLRAELVGEVGEGGRRARL